MSPALSHIDHWIFDLDNTLYPASAKLFDQIDVKMGDYISRLLNIDAVEAKRIQKQFFLSHGTTLSGLMEAHGIEPGHFLDYVHDIDLEVIDEDRELALALAALPGRKIVFTNGDAPYAERVLQRLGLSASFEAIHDIRACNYVPKPEQGSYEALCRTLEIKPDRALFVEDMARNLKPAKAMGMVTVWVNNGSESGSHEAESHFIDYEITAVTPWLRELVEAA